MTQLRPLGSSGLSTPALVFGGNVFGWTLKQPGAFDVLDRFLAGGGTMIDTADVYSAWIEGHVGGESETVLGAWMAERGNRSDVQIATKVGMLPLDGPKPLDPELIARHVEASLNRLQTDYIDLYYAHQDDPDTPMDEVLHAFSELVDAGKVKALGASNFSAGRLGEALEMSAARGWASYSVLQPEFNLIRRHRFAGALQDLCIEKNIGVLSYFGLASGFLTGKYRSQADTRKSARGDRMTSYFTDSNIALLGVMDEIAAETGASLSQISLAWIAAQPGITAPIASATSVAQLDELLGSLTLQLNAEHLARLDAAGA
jgi:aryl-alcohol dehydrogenase-like predicted oxidoreductase